jgi:hypothetical protein
MPPGYEPVFILRVTRLAGLQSKVPGLVGSTRCQVPFTSCTSTEQADEARAPMLTGPTMPWASNDYSSLLSALNSVCRSRVPPLAVAFSTASWNSSAATNELTALLSRFFVPPTSVTSLSSAGLAV